MASTVEVAVGLVTGLTDQPDVVVVVMGLVRADQPIG
jgi:hypothetical protein